MATNPFDPGFSFAEYAAEIDQYNAVPSKLEALAKNKEQKLLNLGQTSREKFYDADTFYKDGEGIRIGTPEGTYPQAPESPNTIRKKYGREATPEEVAQFETSMKVLDNYAAGVVPASQEAIQSLVDKPLSAKDQTLYNQAIQETEVSPLDITGVEGHTGKYGRQIASVQNPEQPDTLQERLVGSGIAPELQGQAARNALQKNEGLYAGAAFDDDGMLGESIDIAQSSMIQEWGKVNKAVVDSGRWLGEKLGVSKETMEQVLPNRSGIFDKKFTDIAQQEVADKMAGVMAKTREEQQAGMQSALSNIKKGNYFDAGFDTFKVLPYMLGDSAGEMAAIMLGTPGITLAVAARVNEDAETYEKNNGVKPDAQWMLGSTVANAAALFGEKVLIKSGLGDIIEKGVSKAKRLGGVAESAIGETVQEYYDQIQQEYMTQKEGEKTLGEIATSPEAQLGALAGGVMGGALRGAGEVGGAVVDQTKPLAGRLADEIERRKALKAEQEQAISEAETVNVPKTLSETYGGPENAAVKETEYKAAIDKALDNGDIYGAITALQQYSVDQKSDTEGLFDKNEYTSRVNKVKEAMSEIEKNLGAGIADKKIVQMFGSSPEMIDTVMENKSPEEAAKFLETYQTTYGSDAPGVERLQQQVAVKKSLEEVGTEVSTDIVKKADAIKNATTDAEREAAIQDFERFKTDRIGRSSKLDNWVAGLERDLTASVQKEAESTGKSVEEVLSDIIAEEAKKKDAGHTYTTKDVHTTPVTAKKQDIAQNLLNQMNGADAHKRGIYSIVGTKSKELEAFNNVAKLVGLETKSELDLAEDTRKEAETTAYAEESKAKAPVKTKTKKKETKIEQPKVTGKDVANDVAKLVKAKKFEEARALVNKSPVNKESKEKLHTRIDTAEGKVVEPVVEEAKADEVTSFTFDETDAVIEEVKTAADKDLKKVVTKSFKFIDDFEVALAEYVRRLTEIETEKEVIQKRIDAHKEEIKKFRAKIGIAKGKRKKVNEYSKEGLKGLRNAKMIATASMRIIKQVIASVNEFKDMILKHRAAIKDLNEKMFELNVEAKELQKERKTYVSRSIIAKSKLNKQMQDVLMVKSSNSQLASDPYAGEVLVDSIAELDDALNHENIEKIITDKFSNLVDKGVVSSKTAEFKDSVDKDVARVLFDSNDKLDPNVIGAISKSLIEYLLKYGTGVMAQDPKTVAQMLGYGDDVEAMPAEAMKLVGNKTFKKNVADTLGKIIQNEIGLTVDPEAVVRLNKNVKLFRPAENLEEKFTASLGQIAAIVGGELGIFTEVDNIAEENQLSAEQYANIAAGVELTEGVEHTGIDMIGIGELGKKLITSKDMYTKFNEIVEEYSEDTYLKEVRTTPVKDKEITQKVDAEVFKPSKFNKDVITKSREQSWRLDFAALDLFEKNVDLVKEYLGYVPTEKNKDGKEKIPSMSYVDEQNQLAKNNSIDLKLRLLDNLKERIQDKDTDLFFEYFYGSNGRYYLDNNEANPQNDKFNRFMLGLASNNVDVDLGTEGASTNTFYVALAQAFGEDVDKMSTEKSIEAGRNWLEKGSKQIEKELKEKSFEPEEIGHTLQGILAVQAYENSKGKPFKTNLVIETDAVTSGIILKTLQLPVMGVDKAKELLKKGGIVFKGDKDYDTFIGTNKLIEDGQLDLYRTLAQTYSGKIEKYLEDKEWEVKPKKGEELSKGQKMINDRRQRVLDASREGGIMPAFSTEPANIKGTLRKIFKPVVMVFGYGGGIGSIKRKFVSEIIEELPTKLLAEVRSAQTAIKAGQPRPEMPILAFFKAVAPDMKITESMLREKDILNKKIGKKTLRDIMISDMTALYGNLLEGSLSDVFGAELVDANRKLNNSFRMMFRVFDYKYKLKLDEFEKTNNRKPTADEKAEIILDMKEEFPAVAPPFAKDTEKGIIVDTKTSGDVQIKAQTMGKFERGKGQKTISIAAVVKEFEEAISAGNVVPIHYIDASIMGTTFLETEGITQIFDAVVSNTGNAFEANGRYNENTIKVSRDYSLTEKVLESLDQSINTLTKEEKAMFLADDGKQFTIEEYGAEESEYLTFEDVRDQMNELNTDANTVRKELFGTDLKVDHMTGLGAVVEFSGDKVIKSGPTKVEVKSPKIKEEPSKEDLASIEKDIKQAYRNINRFGKPKKPKKTKTSAKEAKGRAAQVQIAREVPIGGDEDAAIEAVKKLFKKEVQLDEQFRDMTEDDLVAYEEYMADVDQYGISMERAVEAKEKHGILPDNKKLDKAIKDATNKECKQ